jgi:hypothetical protein
MNKESKPLKLTCGTVGTLVSLVGCPIPIPMLLAEDVDVDGLNLAKLDGPHEVPVCWLNLDGDLRRADIDVRLLVDWTPPEKRRPNQELIAFVKEMIDRYGPPPRATGADQAPAWGMWPENAPGEAHEVDHRGAPGSEPEALRVPASEESVARTEPAADGVRVAPESQSFTSDDPRAPWNQKRA